MNTGHYSEFQVGKTYYHMYRGNTTLRRYLGGGEWSTTDGDTIRERNLNPVAIKTVNDEMREVILKKKQELVKKVEALQKELEDLETATRVLGLVD